MSKDSPFYGLDRGVRIDPDSLEDVKSTENANFVEWPFDPKRCYVDLLKAVMFDRDYSLLDISLITNTPIDVIRRIIKNPKGITARIATRMAVSETLKNLAEIISGKDRTK